GSLVSVALPRQFLLDAYAEKQALEHELNLAREIQQDVLPDAAPVVAGFDIAGWNRPADQTGGDAYDFIRTAQGEIGIMVGDAAGHGIGPALVGVECRALIRALAASTTGLTHILGTTSAILTEDLQEGRFVTLCLAFLDAARSTLTFASAGQAPLLYYHAASDAFLNLPISGPPLGFNDRVSYAPAPQV